MKDCGGCAGDEDIICSELGHFFKSTKAVWQSDLCIADAEFGLLLLLYQKVYMSATSTGRFFGVCLGYDFGRVCVPQCGVSVTRERIRWFEEEIKELVQWYVYIKSSYILLESVNNL